MQAYLLYADGLVHPENLRIESAEGGPPLNAETYQIEAKAVSPESPTMMLGPMTQKILEDRFKLKVHWETREIPVYALTVAKGGPKLKPYVERSCKPMEFPVTFPPSAPLQPGEKPCVLINPNGPHSGIDAIGVTMDEFCKMFPLGPLGGPDRPIIDKTGLTGKFDFHLEFALNPPGGGQTGGLSGSPSPGGVGAGANDANAPDFFIAIQEQLGLKLESAKGPGDFLVIDHVEEPSPN